MNRLRIADIILRNMFDGDHEYLAIALETADDIIADSAPAPCDQLDNGCTCDSCTAQIHAAGI